MLSKKPEWQALQAHRQKMENIHMRDLFAQDPQRFQKFSLKHEGMLLDYSKQRVTDETLALLINLAKSCDIEKWRDRMFTGDKINTTENRAVVHTALRAPVNKDIIIDGENIMPAIHQTLGKMKLFSDSLRDGARTGHSGKAIKTVINIGVGGSDLGPRMTCESLSGYASSPITVRFVSNVDPSDMEQALECSDPETTLFIIASKSFTTNETMVNAAAARQWILDNLKDNAAIEKHFVAISGTKDKPAEFGIAPDNIFIINDWVGGRYSLWSAIGLPVCIAIGFENFRALLDGAYVMDKHFKEAPLPENIPVILALLGVWNYNFWNAQNHAILPYNHYLSYLPAFLQQLEMESNGKSVDREGRKIDYNTSPAIFGGVGTNGQHAFHQLLHQGTDIIPCDFIGTLEGKSEAHKILLANMAAQSKALMQGRTLEESGGASHRIFEGNRPSATILLQKLDPFYLGMLLALYEHKTFIQGIIWNINSFDQWGVELGKDLARDILTENTGLETKGLIHYIQSHVI